MGHRIAWARAEFSGIWTVRRRGAQESHRIYYSEEKIFCSHPLQKKVRLRFGGTGGPPTYDHDLSGHSKTTEVATLISFFHHLPYHRF